MRLLAFLLFVSSVSLAQTNVVVKSQTGEQLEGVSIYEISASNSLISITDSAGMATINLQEGKQYLFHLLGYADQILSNEELKKVAFITLQSNTIQLNEVVVKRLKFKTIKLISKPGNWNFGESNNIKTTFERATPIKIDNRGFLKSFKLFANQSVQGEVRVFRFIIFESEEGRPGKSLINQSVKGILKGGKMIFNLDSLSLFLDSGDYFIGYETLNNGVFSSYAKKSKSNKGTILRYPMIYIEGKASDTPKVFYRTNLKKWDTFEKGLIRDIKGSSGRYYEFAYEVEMNIPIKK